MNALKAIYVGVLTTLLILAGCFGTGVIDDGEGENTGTGNEDTGTNDGTGTGGSGGTTSTAMYNAPPITEASLYSIVETYVTTQVTTTETTVDDNGVTVTTTTTQDVETLSGFEIVGYHAMLDWDGSIVQAGWDTNLDGVIDTAVTDASGFTTLQIPLASWHNMSGEEYVITMAFGAQDDDGAWSDGSLLTIQTIGEPPAPEGTLNSYRAEDHPTDTTDGNNDSLIRLSFTHGPDDLEWAFLTIHLFDEEDGQTYVCSPGGASCSIAEETADSVFGGSEIISLKENSADICGKTGNSGGEGNSCQLKVTMMYNGMTVAGTSGVISII